MSCKTPQADGRTDWVGVACSVVCAVHCAATPIVLSLLPTASSFRWIADPMVHQLVAMVCCCIVAAAIVPTIHRHRDWKIATLATTGLALLLIAAFILPDTCCEPNQTSSLETRGVVALDSSSEAASMGLFRLAAEPVSRWTMIPNTKEPSWQLPISTAAYRIPQSSPLKLSSPLDSNSPTPACDGGFASGRSNDVGRSLITPAQLEGFLGTSIASYVAWAHPFLTPIGGLLLVFAHLRNIRLRCRGHGAHC